VSWIDHETLLIEDHTRPLITLAAVMPMRLLDDPPGQEGLTYLTAQMLTRGAGDYDHAALHEELDVLGAQLHVSASRNGTTLSGDVLTRNLDAYESIVTDVLTRPRFDPSEFEKLKRRTLAEIEQVKDHDDALGMRYFVRELFEGHPYGRPSMGTKESLSALTVSDVVACYERHFSSEVRAQAAAGDISPQRLQSFFSATLGQLPPGVVELSVPPRASRPAGHHLTLVDKPQRSQTQVFIGQPTIDANHPDALALLIGNMLFGGTFTARLSHEIREKRGWSYGVSSSFGPDRHVGTFIMRFFPGNDQTVPAIRLADSMFQSLVAAGGTVVEVEAAKRYLIQSHPLSMETPERELLQRLGARLLGRDDQWVDRFTEQVSEITTEQVNHALRTHLDPDHLLTTVVCTASDLRDAVDTWDRPTATRTVAYDVL